MDKIAKVLGSVIILFGMFILLALFILDPPQLIYFPQKSYAYNLINTIAHYFMIIFVSALSLFLMILGLEIWDIDVFDRVENLFKNWGRQKRIFFGGGRQPK